MPIAKLVSDYEQLLNYEFEFELENNNKITLVFEEKYLKHLLGFQNIDPLFRFSGSKIYDNLKSGKFTIINESNLLLNSNIYKNKKVIDKIMNFPLVKSQLFSPINNQNLIDFDKLKVSPSSNQGSEFLFHFESTDNTTRYHLGISKDSTSQLYFPRSFFIEKDKRKDSYVVNQVELKIKKINRKNKNK